MAPKQTDVEKTETVRPYQQLAQEVNSIAALDSDQGGRFEIAAQVIDLIASADDEESIFAANETGPADMQDWLNQPLTVTDIMFLKSAERFRDGGLGAYVVLTHVTDNGDTVTLTTGAPNVVASARQFQRLGYGTPEKPARFRVVGKETANGVLYKIARP